MKEPKAMEEIHRIREQLYERRKKMTAEEEIRDIQASVVKFEKETGIKLRQLERSRK